MSEQNGTAQPCRFRYIQVYCVINSAAVHNEVILYTFNQQLYMMWSDTFTQRITITGQFEIDKVLSYMVNDLINKILLNNIEICLINECPVVQLGKYYIITLA